jgi:hypothetical protein
VNYVYVELNIEENTILVYDGVRGDIRIIKIKNIARYKYIFTMLVRVFPPRDCFKIRVSLLSR